MDNTEIRLIAAYHRNADAIAKQAIEVSVAEESFNQGSQQLIFETSRRGNYWIVSEQQISYLIPKNDIKINQHNYSTFQKIFECSNFPKGDCKDFLLIKPVIVSATLFDQRWELVSSGIVEFVVTDSPERELPILPDSETSESQSQQTNVYAQQLIDRLEQLEIKLTARLKQLEIGLKVLEHQTKTSSESQFSSMKTTQIPPLEKAAQTQLQQTPPQSQVPAPSVYQIPPFIYAYNQNPNSFSKSAIPVVETEESIENQRLGQNQPIIFGNKSRGDYWILKKGNSNYLVPRANLRINQLNGDTVSTIFECRGYYSSYNRFELLKPARVFPIAASQKWQLEERGVLEFY